MEENTSMRLSVRNSFLFFRPNGPGEKATMGEPLDALLDTRSLMAPLDLLWQAVLAMGCNLDQVKLALLQVDMRVQMAETAVASKCSRAGAIHCLCGEVLKPWDLGEKGLQTGQPTGITATEKSKAGQGCPALWQLSPTQLPHFPAQSLCCTHSYPRVFQKRMWISWPSSKLELGNSLVLLFFLLMVWGLFLFFFFYILVKKCLSDSK